MFAVIEQKYCEITGEVDNKTVMESDCELMCYEQALVLQRLTFNHPEDTQRIYYLVEEEF